LGNRKKYLIRLGINITVKNNRLILELDKIIEQNRYNQSSKNKLSSISEAKLKTIGAKNFPPYLQSPYIFYEELLKSHVNSNMKVMDLCCGDGIHSISLGYLSNHVIATDIADNSIEFAKLRVKALKMNSIQFLTGDAEDIQFPDNNFDVVTCVGSISYVELEKFTAEVLRILKPGGRFIALDSFNHNPLYKFNRYLHYLKGNRSISTLNRMPSEKTLRYLEGQFQSIEKHYFGIFTFIAPLFSSFLGETKSKKVIDYLDRKISFLKKYSFKIVLFAIK
jgi:ubiquinone/menaquinone biosynthesis C-methylase UbiE